MGKQSEILKKKKKCNWRVASFLRPTRARASTHANGIRKRNVDDEREFEFERERERRCGGDADGGDGTGESGDAKRE